MQVLQIEAVSAYAEHLRQEPSEGDALFRELLIGVTQFFRDEDAFDALKLNVLPSLLAARDADEPIRVWVAGCATGEEVYSIAILLQEVLGAHRAEVAGHHLRNRYRSASHRVRAHGTVPPNGWPVTGTAATLVCKGRRGLHSDSRHPRDVRLLRAQSGQGPSILQNRPHFLPQRADLHGQRLSAPRHADIPLCASARWLPVHRTVGERQPRIAPVQRRRQEASHPATPRQRESGIAGISAPGGDQRDHQAAAARTEDQIDKSARRVMAKHSPAYFVIDRHYNIVRYSGGETGRYHGAFGRQCEPGFVRQSGKKPADAGAPRRRERLFIGPAVEGEKSEGRRGSDWSISSSSRLSNPASHLASSWWRFAQSGPETNRRPRARRRRPPSATSKRSSRNCATCKSAIKRPATNWKARSKT